MKIGETKRNRLLEQFSNDVLKQLFEEKKISLNSVWGANCFQLCDGKKMLQEFINRHIKPFGRDIDVPSLRSLIINQMKLSKKIPEDIDNVMRKILGETMPSRN